MMIFVQYYYTFSPVLVLRIGPCLCARNKLDRLENLDCLIFNVNGITDTQNRTLTEIYKNEVILYCN
uniref:Uncharacterized protein n=1 Tax=Rhizophora mucronata TaxID=61149 RepID=A0A2P2J241_RHIMU